MLLDIYVSQGDPRLEELGLSTDDDKEYLIIPVFIRDEQIIGYWVDPGDNDFVIYLRDLGQFRSPYKEEVAIQLSMILGEDSYILKSGTEYASITSDEDIKF